MKVGHNWMGKKTTKKIQQNLILGRLFYLSPKQMGMSEKMNYD